MTPLAAGGLVTADTVVLVGCCFSAVVGVKLGKAKKCPDAYELTNVLFWLLRMELNCRSEETSKHNSGLTSSGAEERGGAYPGCRHCSAAQRGLLRALSTQRARLSEEGDGVV